MAYKLNVSAEAHEDVSEIVGYIVLNLSNPIAAKRLLDSIQDEYKTICESPNSYSLCSDKRLRSEGYRKIVVKNYVIIYRVDEERNIVNVVRVFYGKRNYEKLI